MWSNHLGYGETVRKYWGVSTSLSPTDIALN